MLNFDQMFRTKIQTWKFHRTVYLMYYTKTKCGYLLQKIGWDFSVYLCAIFVESHEKEYFKENVYKILFCVLKQRGNCLSSGAFVLEDVGGIHLSVPCVPVFTHWLRCVAILPQTMSSTELRLRLSSHTLEIEWHRHSGVQRLGLPPPGGGGLSQGPDLSALRKIHQRELLTAPRTFLLFLVVTRWQMVFLSFYNCKRFFQKTF